MALPWLIGIAAAGLVGAIAKSISEDEAEEERKKKIIEKQEEYEKKKTQEQVAMRAREINRRKIEEKKAKLSLIKNMLDNFISEYQLDNDIDTKTAFEMYQNSPDELKNHFIKIWDSKVENKNGLHEIFIKKTQIEELIDKLSLEIKNEQ